MIIFYLRATNHVSVQSFTKFMHHKCMATTAHLPTFFTNNVTLFVKNAKLPMLFCLRSLQWNSLTVY